MSDAHTLAARQKRSTSFRCQAVLCIACCVRTRLSGSALELLRRRIIAAIAVAWLPLLLLTLLDGHVWSGVAVPFLADVGAQARLLVSLPLLIAAERVVDRQMRATLPSSSSGDCSRAHSASNSQTPLHRRSAGWTRPWWNLRWWRS